MASGTDLAAQNSPGGLNVGELLGEAAEGDSINKLLLDSIEVVRRLDMLKEAKPVEDKVVVELNKKRFSRLSYKWWDMPTEEEQKNIDNGRYNRYQEPAQMRQLLKTPRVRHAHQKEITNNQNVVVWGWHPYYAKNAYENYNYSLLTHIAHYAYELNPFTGGYHNFQAIHEFKNNELITLAHKDSCKVLLTFSCHHPETSEIFFTSTPVVRQNAIDSLMSILYYANGDGVELNFEEVPVEYKQEFLNFVKDLSFQLREFNPNYTIAMTLPMEDEQNVYDIGFLQNWVDLFVLSTYNFHLGATTIYEGSISPLYNPDASIRRTYATYTKRTNLDSLLQSPGTISNITILHTEGYMSQLLDTLNAYIRAEKIEGVANELFDLSGSLSVIRSNDRLRMNPGIRKALRRTICQASLYKTYSQTSAANNNFFLFEPERDTLNINEFSLFNQLAGILPVADSLEPPAHLSNTIKRFVRQIGRAHSSSLVLGLPYYGTLWKGPAGDRSFEGYIPYAAIRNKIRTDSGSVYYDKVNQSMVAVFGDSMRIYFDNASSLSKKIDLAFDREMGGVAIWALSYDHGYTELWGMLEDKIAARTVWNSKKERMEQFKIKKSNKIHYTVTYQMKRNSNLVLATLVFIAIFMTIGFAFALLDWRVRDVMFYSGAFRIFYLTVFTVLILVIASYLGLFQNRMAAFLVGIILGGIITWLATVLVTKRHEKLP